MAYIKAKALTESSALPGPDSHPLAQLQQLLPPSIPSLMHLLDTTLCLSWE